MPRSHDPSFLSRWSKRKLSSEPDAPSDEALPDAPGADRIAEDALSDEELLEKLGLPDPDTLGEGDNFSVFMKSGIPDRLRRRALRRLWISNPVLANLDELVDYGEDFTDAAMVVENMQTVYEVGKGAAARVQAELDAARAEREAAAEAARAAGETEPRDGDDLRNAMTGAEKLDDTEEEGGAEAEPDAQGSDASEVAAVTPLAETIDPIMRKVRPMQFEFE